jgi:hypothetical protein
VGLIPYRSHWRCLTETFPDLNTEVEAWAFKKREARGEPGPIARPY